MSHEESPQIDVGVPPLPPELAVSPIKTSHVIVGLFVLNVVAIAVMSASMPPKEDVARSIGEGLGYGIGALGTAALLGAALSALGAVFLGLAAAKVGKFRLTYGQAYVDTLVPTLIACPMMLAVATVLRNLDAEKWGYQVAYVVAQTAVQTAWLHFRRHIAFGRALLVATTALLLYFVLGCVIGMVLAVVATVSGPK
jgi:hypothetical protein